MQAGDRLEFIKPFDPSDTKKGEEYEKKAADLFAGICITYLSKYYDARETLEKVEESGIITVFELPLEIRAADGSYLYFVICGHHDDKGVLDLYLSIEEHGIDGVTLGGYLYALDSEGLQRSISTKDEVSDLHTRAEDLHFSLIRTYEAADDRSVIELLGDEEEQRLTQAFRAELEEGILFDQLEQELGTDGQCPSLDELAKLEVLLTSAVPFDR